MLVIFFLFLLLLVPLAVPRFWMVLWAGATVFAMLIFFNWSAVTADPSARLDLLQLVVPAARDAGIYTIVASALYGIKRLFVRGEPRKNSNID